MLAIDAAQSAVDIAVTATVDSFAVHLGKFNAAIAVDGVIGNVVTAEFDFRFSDLKTGDAGRDAEMDEWEEIERYPDGQFTLDAVEPGGAGKFVARGRLRFHGVERDVSFPVTVAARRDTLTIAGSTSLDTRDYGLPVYRRFIIFRVDPVVQVKFRLVGKLLAP